ncbi:MAG: hypothetical protein QOH88_3106 [Verrucomicrobiota bacterium]|jgi:hypothetical protein
MLPLQQLGAGCFTIDFSNPPPRVEGKTYLGCNWDSGEPPELSEGEILLGENDFRDVVFTVPETRAMFYGSIDWMSPTYPHYAILRAADIMPIFPRTCRDALWVDLKYLPAIVQGRLGAVRLITSNGPKTAIWLKPSHPYSEEDVKTIGYHFVSDNRALAPIDRAVPVGEVKARGLIFDARTFDELNRFGVEGLTAVALTTDGLRMSRFRVIGSDVAVTTLPWLRNVAGLTVINCDWPFKHGWRLGVSVDQLGSLKGSLGECIYEHNELWVRSEHLKLRAGCDPIPLKDHPSARMPWFLTSEETREAHFTPESRARTTHVTRGLKRYRLIEEGQLVSQIHYSKADLAGARLRSELAVRKARLQAEYRGFDLPMGWERFSDDALAAHVQMETLIRKEGWRRPNAVDALDDDANARFRTWMEANGLSVTSPLSKETCYRYRSPRDILKTHDAVELIQFLYPRGCTFLFLCASQEDFAGKAIAAALRA